VSDDSCTRIAQWSICACICACLSFSSNASFNANLGMQVNTHVFLLTIPCCAKFTLTSSELTTIVTSSELTIVGAALHKQKSVCKNGWPEEAKAAQHATSLQAFNTPTVRNQMASSSCTRPKKEDVCFL